MKNILALALGILLIPTSLLWAQAPEGISYQAVARDGNVFLANANVTVRFSVLEGVNPVYVEEHAATTNMYGLFDLTIGEGVAATGTFSGIDWKANDHFLRVEIDKGSGFVNMGTMQFVSVPYSLYAKEASRATDMELNDLNNVDTGSPASDQVMKWNGSAWLAASDEVNDADANASNEIQNLSLSGNLLSLSQGGGTVTLPTGPTYSGGTGISISGSTINNTGDTNPGDDITNISTAGGDVSGTFSALQVQGLQGRQISATAPANGEVLKWNGSNWAPSSDDAGSSIWSTTGIDAYYNAGDVGIGTSSPEGSLGISANSALSDPHIWLHEDGNDYARLNFDNNNGSNYWTIAAYIASNNRNDRLNFWNGTSGDVMTITGDGEVGIGVGISPKVPFHVGNNRRILFGTDTLGNGDKLMFLPDLHAFRVGTVASGAASTYWNRDSIGLYSFASGLNTRAQGFGATAMGRDTEATNSYAFASGFFTNADGQYSTAMGFNTDALALGATSLGYSTDATGNYSTALGYFSSAESFACTAIGRHNVGGGSGTSWISTDAVFEVGIGSSSLNRENAMTIRKNGNVGIGTNTPGATLHVDGQIRVGSLEEFSDGGSFLMQVNSSFIPETNGNRNLGNSTFRWNTVYATNGTINTSDRREKHKIKGLSYGLDAIMRLNPVSYRWNEHPEQGAKLGLIAQEVQSVIPEVVMDREWITNEENGEMEERKAHRLGIYYSDLIPVLIKATQEQQNVIELQEKQIDQLEARLQALEKLIQSKR